MEKINVLLADDFVFIREGLRWLLEAEEDIAVVGEASTGLEAVQLTQKLLPEIVIIDIDMPVLSGLEATRQIKQTWPNIHVLALSCYSDDKFVRQMLDAGVTGYLQKQNSATELIQAVREAKRGRPFFSPPIAARWRKIVQGEQSPTEKLTPREEEVLKLVAEGYATKEIAGELHSSVGTVVKQRQQVMNKLNLHNIAALTRYAISEGILKAWARKGSKAEANKKLPKPSKTTLIASIPDQTRMLVPLI